MRVCCYLEGDGRRLGLLQGDVVVPVTALDAKAKMVDAMPLAALTLDLPVRGSGKIFCLGLNYVAHALEGSHS
jgi:2-keto-4-pentenoate hydratase/2-oxohepta-3-ene-1,7-dioic acid hydratase in catechol pathway